MRPPRGPHSALRPPPGAGPHPLATILYLPAGGKEAGVKKGGHGKLLRDGAACSPSICPASVKYWRRRPPISPRRTRATGGRRSRPGCWVGTSWAAGGSHPARPALSRRDGRGPAHVRPRGGERCAAGGGTRTGTVLVGRVARAAGGVGGVRSPPHTHAPCGRGRAQGPDDMRPSRFDPPHSTGKLRPPRPDSPSVKRHVLLALVGGLAIALAAHAAKPADSDPKAPVRPGFSRPGAATALSPHRSERPPAGDWAPVPSTQVYDDWHVRCLAQNRHHAPGPVQAGEALKKR